MKKIADVETPYMAQDEDTLRRNILYARLACSWALKNGYIPYASHLFFTQPGLLDDDKPEERELGINAGKDLIKAIATHTLVFKDLGESTGMKYGVVEAQKCGREIIEINLFKEDISKLSFVELQVLAKQYGLLTGDYSRKGW